MRFLAALLLYCLFFSVAAKASDWKSYVPAKKEAQTTVSASAIRVEVPLKKTAALGRNFYDQFDLFQQHANHVFVACYKETAEIQFFSLAIDHESLWPFGRQAKFYKLYILGCLYPKHTFW